MLCVSTRHLCAGFRAGFPSAWGRNPRSQGGDCDLWAHGDWIFTPELCPSLSWQGPVTAEVLNSSWEQILYLGSSDREAPGEGHQRENKSCCPLAAQIC